MSNKPNNNNIIWFQSFVKRRDRNIAYGHKSGLIWFTGLPSSGKSTIAHSLEKELFERGIKCYVLDGDNIRHGLNSDLGFSEEDRKENIRRIAEVSKLFIDAGIIVLAAFVSPYRKHREYLKEFFKEDNFIEVYVKCPIDECIKRDLKGNYKKAIAGIIKGYTGIDDPYEEPENPDIIIDTTKLSVKDAVEMLFNYLKEKEWF